MASALGLRNGLENTVITENHGNIDIIVCVTVGSKVVHTLSVWCGF